MKIAVFDLGAVHLIFPYYWSLVAVFEVLSINGDTHLEVMISTK